jgi:hypothetical protein
VLPSRSSIPTSRPRYKAGSDTKSRRTVLAAYFRTADFVSEPKGYRARNRKFESSSLQDTVCLSPAAAFEGREPGFPRRFARMAWRPRRAETPGCFDIAPTGECLWRAEFQYGSEADVVGTVPGRSGRSQDLFGLSIGKSLKFGSGLRKPSTVRWSGQASGRRECSRSFYAVKSGGCRPSRIASVISGARLLRRTSRVK